MNDIKRWYLYTYIVLYRAGVAERSSWAITIPTVYIINEIGVLFQSQIFISNIYFVNLGWQKCIEIS